MQWPFLNYFQQRYRAANGMEDNDFLPSFFPFPLDIDSLSLFDAEGVNLAMNRLDFSAPRNRQRRNVERLRRLHVGIQDSEVPATTGRLREVGRSLEMLNNAIHEGATLETLNVAVEALRMGLGRLQRGQRNGSRDGIFRRHYVEDGAIEEDAGEDDVMERLETLVHFSKNEDIFFLTFSQGRSDACFHQCPSRERRNGSSPF